jgi:hypothetical protein
LTPPGEVPTFEDPNPVDANHREMCRFTSAQDKTYVKTVESIKRLYSSQDCWQLGNEYYLVPDALSSLFTGRAELGKLLKDCLFLPSQAKQHRIFVLYGLGGSGKTQLCLNFASVHRQK